MSVVDQDPPRQGPSEVATRPLWDRRRMLVGPHEVLDCHAVDHAEAGVPVHHAYGDFSESVVWDRGGAALTTPGLGVATG
ncbi:hypothetical protein JOD64_000216 [Micromonospora luteifusca]|uniref:Uncharacterized protein n=1 Tax=Micromonospora luteifusca TaxID=709860 RepID=A0ABS2LM61_9ACTN|nr:hypothetical protein [Micromonospora luteifusca]MBM7488994.1 hypothetical protein [Micromonospora luteifusca]